MTELDFLNQLAGIQYNAVTSESQHLQILAVPGSGKTRDPTSIVAVTFTNKAAKEMKERLCSPELLGTGKTQQLLIGTFHSVCARLIRRHPHYCGLKGNFMIANPEKSRDIINKIIHSLRLANVAGANKPDVYFNEISKSRNKGIDCDKYANMHAKSPKKQNTINVFRAYEKELTRLNYVDFDSLLILGKNLLKIHPEIVNNIEHILVDEFQDTNTIQYQILKAMSYGGKHVTVVGDPDQSIFGWRDGDSANFKYMQADFASTEVVHMGNSFRSTKHIIETAEKVVELDTMRNDRPLSTSNGQGSPVKVLVADSEESEADIVAREITRIIDECKGLIGYNDIVVLVRMNYLTRNFEQVFMSTNIPCIVVGGPQFLERVEIRDIIAYLSFCFNPEDTLSFEQIINVPNRGIGDTTIQYLLEQCIQNETNVIEVIKVLTGRTNGPPPRLYISAKVKSSLTEFLYIYEDVKRQIETKVSLPDIISIIIELTEYNDYLKSNFSESYESRWENVGELISYSTIFTSQLATRVVSIDQDPVIGFLEAVALGPDQVEPDENSKGRVTISTIHNAKGLEWPCVFITACEEGIIPHSRVESEMEECGMYGNSTNSYHKDVPHMPKQFGANTPQSQSNMSYITPDSTQNSSVSLSTSKFSTQEVGMNGLHSMTNDSNVEKTSILQTTTISTEIPLSINTLHSNTLVTTTLDPAPKEDPENIFDTHDLSINELEIMLNAPDSPIDLTEPSQYHTLETVQDITTENDNYGKQQNSESLPTQSDSETFSTKCITQTSESSCSSQDIKILHEYNLMNTTTQNKSKSSPEPTDISPEPSKIFPEPPIILPEPPKISPELSSTLKKYVIRCVKEAGQTQDTFTVDYMELIVDNELRKSKISIPHDETYAEVKRLFESLVDSGDMIYSRCKKLEKYTIVH
ncbi:P-loop containing nucleoside triphosphate hydrolase protein [Phycomyces nitens]|nr:P-loop containing nucleoside triphosphate hydrolase protein [Phycomyces nitens]